MKRIISLILFLTMVGILIGGCAGMPAQRPSDQGSWTNEVGKSTFVGDHSRTGPGAQFQRSVAIDMITP